MSRARSSALHSRWGMLLCGAAAGVFILLLGEAVVLSTTILAHRSAWPLEEFFGNLAVDLTAKVHNDTPKKPATFNAQQTLAQGQTLYVTQCGGCHGTRGDGKSASSANFFPRPTDLVNGHGKELRDDQFFYLTKHGISFSAMPTYANSLKDDQIWAIVAYVRSVQKGQAVQLAPLLPGARPPAQVLAITSGDGGAQPQALSATAGDLELDVTNKTAAPHQYMLSTIGKVPYVFGPVASGQTMKQITTLPAGSYTLTQDPQAQTPGPAITLTVQ